MAMPNDKAEVTPATASADTVPDALAIYVTISKGMCVYYVRMYIIV